MRGLLSMVKGRRFFPVAGGYGAWLPHFFAVFSFALRYREGSRRYTFPRRLSFNRTTIRRERERSRPWRQAGRVAELPH